ncbi:hypothetical protein ACHAQA_005833 [Verticillium albo-atrum]
MMFAQPFHDTTRKRLREEDPEAGAGSCGFSEHRNKRLQLPVRTSPTSTSQKRPAPTFPPTSTPHSQMPGEYDTDLPSSHFSPWSSSPTLGMTSPGFDRDMDMAMDTAMSPLHNRQQLQSNPLLVDPSGRMPTPIQSNFSSQVRGPAGWNGPGPAVTHQNGLTNMGHVHSAAYQDRTVPRTMQTGDGWHSAVQRRIPSPISEADSRTASPGMCLESGVSNGFPSQLTARLEQSTLSPSGEDMGMMDVSPSFSTHTEGVPEHDDSEDGMAPLTETISAPATPSPGRSRGHMRSHHTINTWTWQPGMKKSFSIGYRADCEKCRLKVPGHFNHIIVS